jgi:hypothetical protein
MEPGAGVAVGCRPDLQPGRRQLSRGHKRCDDARALKATYLAKRAPHRLRSCTSRARERTSRGRCGAVVARPDRRALPPPPVRDALVTAALATLTPGTPGPARRSKSWALVMSWAHSRRQGALALLGRHPRGGTRHAPPAAGRTGRQLVTPERTLCPRGFAVALEQPPVPVALSRSPSQRLSHAESLDLSRTSPS